MAPLAHVHAYKSVHTAAYLLSTGLYPVRATIPRVYVCTYIFTPLHVFLPRWYVAASANIAIRTRITETGAPPGIRRRRTTTTTIEFGSIFLSPRPPPNLLAFLVYHFSNYRDDNFSCLESTNLLAYSRKFSITSENTSNETPPSLYSSQEIVKVACAEKMAQNASADHPVRIISSPG